MSSYRFRALLLALALAAFPLLAAEPPATEPPASEPPASEPPASELPASEPTASEPTAAESASQSPNAKPAGALPLVWHLVARDAVHPMLADFLAKTLTAADVQGVDLLVLELDTPGGSLAATRQMAESMMGARTPVLVHVAPAGGQAASAGFFLLMAGDFATMAPGTNTGAAHPVGGGGEDIEGHMGEKVEQDSLALIRSLAGRHGRNVDLAQEAVAKSRSFTAEEALEGKLIDFVEADLTKIFAGLDGRTIDKQGSGPRTLRVAGARVEEKAMNWMERILAVVAHPQIAGILLAIGMLGIVAEVYNPGLVFPGMIGAICLLVGFAALSVLPFDKAGIALLVVALGLFIAEAITPTFGVLALGGTVALVFGLLMTFKDFTPRTFVVDAWPILVVALMILALSWLSVWKTLKINRQKPATGAEAMIGREAEVLEALIPAGKVWFDGEFWSAELEPGEQSVEVGGTVEISQVDGLKLKVRNRTGNQPASNQPASNPYSS